MIAFVITVVSGYLNFNAKRRNYHRQLAERKHEKLIASEDALLTYLINEAEDETLKEVLLTLVGILTRTPRQSGGLTVFGIERNTSEWLRKEMNISTSFKTSHEALEILENARLIVRSKHFLNYSDNANDEIAASSVFPVVIHELVTIKI